MTSIRRFDHSTAMRVLAVAVICLATTLASAAETAMRTLTIRIANHPLKVEVAQREADRQ